MSEQTKPADAVGGDLVANVNDFIQWCIDRRNVPKQDLHWCRQAEELANRLDEIRAVLDSFDPNDWSKPTFAFEARRNFARIRTIVDGEPR